MKKNCSIQSRLSQVVVLTDDQSRKKNMQKHTNPSPIYKNIIWRR